YPMPANANAGVETYYVDTVTGLDGNSGLTPALAKKTIQEAIDTADLNDIIIVSAGTYLEDLAIIAAKTGLELRPASGEDVTLQGVTIGGEPLATPNLVIDADEVKIHGFTIKSAAVDGTDKYATAIHVQDGADVEIYDNAFDLEGTISVDAELWAIIGADSDNVHDIGGLNIHDNTFVGTDLDGTKDDLINAIYINWDTTAITGTVTIEDNVISGDIARGIMSERPNTVVTGNSVTSSLVADASSLGGKAYAGIAVTLAHGTGTIDNTDVTDNTVSEFGTGVWIGRTFGGATLTLTDITVTGNTIEDNLKGVFVELDADEVLVNNNNILYNTEFGIQNDDGS
ncbi:hypothetical protein LCGC14_3114600, partial [marine sediment metagenome]